MTKRRCSAKEVKISPATLGRKSIIFRRIGDQISTIAPPLAGCGRSSISSPLESSDVADAGGCPPAPATNKASFVCSSKLLAPSGWGARIFLGNTVAVQ